MKNIAYNPFETAQEQFDHAADLLDLDQATRDLLRNPMREFHFNIPVRMDDGSVKIKARIPRGENADEEERELILTEDKVLITGLKFEELVNP